MPKSFYCLCKNRYLVEHLCKCDKQPYYWKHGIGRTVALPIEEEVTPCQSVFDSTFDITFGCVTTEEGFFDNTFDITFN